MKEINKSWSEYWAKLFWIDMRKDDESYLNEVREYCRFVKEVLALQKGMKVLDLGCGAGYHLRCLAEWGIEGTGIEVVDSLVVFSNEIAEKESLSFEVLQGDMREIQYREEFDAVTMFTSTFGFFDDMENLELLKRIRTALKRNGRVFLEQANLFVNFKKYQQHYSTAHGLFLDDIDYDFKTGRGSWATKIICEDGSVVVCKEDEKGNKSTIGSSYRIYTVPEIKFLFQLAEISFQEIYCDVDSKKKGYDPSGDTYFVTGEKN